MEPGTTNASINIPIIDTTLLRCNIFPTLNPMHDNTARGLRICE